MRIAPRLTACLAVFSAGFFLAGPAFAAKPSLNKAQLAKLEKGEVIIRRLKPTNDEGVSARAIGLFDAPPEKVFPAVNECGKFREFMPRVKKSEQRAKNGANSVCFVEISMPFPFSNLWSETSVVSKKQADGGFQRRWKHRDGTYTRNTGSWTLYPMGDGKRTLGVYFIDTNPSIAMPDWVIRSAQAGSLPDVFKAIRKRIGVGPNGDD